MKLHSLITKEPPHPPIERKHIQQLLTDSTTLSSSLTHSSLQDHVTTVDGLPRLMLSSGVTSSSRFLLHVISVLGFPNPIVSSGVVESRFPHVTTVFAFPRLKLSFGFSNSAPLRAFLPQMTSEAGGVRTMSSGLVAGVSSVGVRAFLDLLQMTSEDGGEMSMMSGFEVAGVETLRPQEISDEGLPSSIVFGGLVMDRFWGAS